ncbi:uncharacterized protein PHALS_05769 [Plasmopara halstedii]|uniref:Uncharacterized protein n=1 Tax=Plasmopara halstedii TaxID=4781 RepID=A0A0P1ABY5_PLAHL|nr:uncharacterized protein PHALS_05769 [Plasmopara halstedii]CEG37711.1 hypothetical protein PHALS_05769 [Plasmopara halstedii]|eukprot:XP_024574080.1 hypothetical protein PHALS_05769 [Plasmopara halstedii]
MRVATLFVPTLCSLQYWTTSGLELKDKSVKDSFAASSRNHENITLRVCAQL